jgi:hypothetical protein
VFESIDDEGSTDAQTLYLDGDADGFGRDNPSVSIKSCGSVDGYVENNEDCDDERDVVNPNAPEVCDDLDNDCHELTDSEDDSVDVTTGVAFYVDGDSDGFGDKNQESVVGCSLSEGFADNEGDCDDENDEIHPDSIEICDSVDNDCDQKIDDMDVIVGTNVGLKTFYRDVDGDGYGVGSSTIEKCVLPTGYSEWDTDCDDGDRDVFPNSVELCDSVDNDCDQLIDDGDDSVDVSTGSLFFLDGDGDGYGDATSGVLSCALSSDRVDDNTDCDDGNADIHPDGIEVCDSVDNDCDGLTDDADNNVDVSVGGITSSTPTPSPSKSK